MSNVSNNAENNRHLTLMSELNVLRRRRYEILNRFMGHVQAIQDGNLSPAERRLRHALILNLSDQFLLIQDQFRELSSQLEPREE
jgi:hypothetical protein